MLQINSDKHVDILRLLIWCEFKPSGIPVIFVGETFSRCFFPRCVPENGIMGRNKHDLYSDQNRGYAVLRTYNETCISSYLCQAATRVQTFQNSIFCHSF